MKAERTPLRRRALSLDDEKANEVCESIALDNDACCTKVTDTFRDTRGHVHEQHFEQFDDVYDDFVSAFPDPTDRATQEAIVTTVEESHMSANERIPIRDDYGFPVQEARRSVKGACEPETLQLTLADCEQAAAQITAESCNTRVWVDVAKSVWRDTGSFWATTDHATNLTTGART